MVARDKLPCYGATRHTARQAKTMRWTDVAWVLPAREWRWAHISCGSGVRKQPESEFRKRPLHVFWSMAHWPQVQVDSWRPSGPSAMTWLFLICYTLVANTVWADLLVPRNSACMPGQAVLVCVFHAYVCICIFVHLCVYVYKSEVIRRSFL